MKKYNIIAMFIRFGKVLELYDDDVIIRCSEAHAQDKPDDAGHLIIVARPIKDMSI